MKVFVSCYWSCIVKRRKWRWYDADEPKPDVKLTVQNRRSSNTIYFTSRLKTTSRGCFYKMLSWNSGVTCRCFSVLHQAKNIGIKIRASIHGEPAASVEVAIRISRTCSRNAVYTQQKQDKCNTWYQVAYFRLFSLLAEKKPTAALHVATKLEDVF